MLSSRQAGAFPSRTWWWRCRGNGSALGHSVQGVLLAPFHRQAGNSLPGPLSGGKCIGSSNPGVSAASEPESSLSPGSPPSLWPCAQAFTELLRWGSMASTQASGCPHGPVLPQSRKSSFSGPLPPSCLAPGPLPVPGASTAPDLAQVPVTRGTGQPQQLSGFSLELREGVVLGGGEREDSSDCPVFWASAASLPWAPLTSITLPVLLILFLKNIFH